MPIHLATENNLHRLTGCLQTISIPLKIDILNGGKNKENGWQNVLPVLVLQEMRQISLPVSLLLHSLRTDGHVSFGVLRHSYPADWQQLSARRNINYQFLKNHNTFMTCRYLFLLCIQLKSLSYGKAYICSLRELSS